MYNTPAETKRTNHLHLISTSMQSCSLQKRSKETQMLHRALYEFLKIKVSKNTQYAKVNSGECNLLYKFMHKLCVSCRSKKMNLTFSKKRTRSTFAKLEKARLEKLTDLDYFVPRFKMSILCFIHPRGP